LRLKSAVFQFGANKNGKGWKTLREFLLSIFGRIGNFPISQLCFLSPELMIIQSFTYRVDRNSTQPENMSELSTTNPAGVKKSIFDTVSVGEYIGRAPLVFLGVAATVGSLAYGFKSLFTGDMAGQAKGMAGRVGFQTLTIVAIVTAVAMRKSEKDAEKAAKEQRRALRREQEALKAAKLNE